MSEPLALHAWTKPELHRACSAAYNRYHRQKTEAAKAYFAAFPELKDVKHAYKARDIAAALPVGWEGLADLIPPKLRRRHHLSGNSSQLLALGLLGPGQRGLWTAAGHGPWGISTGPATARLVVDTLLGEAEVPAPLSVARF